MTSTGAGAPARLSMTQVLLCGAPGRHLSMGIRHGFGLFLQPLTMDRGWTRRDLRLRAGRQNLAWGIFPLAGVVADRFGAFRVLLIRRAFVCRRPGATMALPPPAPAFTGSAGLLLGMAQAGHHLRRGVRRHRRNAARAPFVGHGHGRAALRPVPHGAGRGQPHRRLGLANALFVLGLLALAHRAAGLRPARASP